MSIDPLDSNLFTTNTRHPNEIKDQRIQISNTNISTCPDQINNICRNIYFSPVSPKKREKKLQGQSNLPGNQSANFLINIYNNSNKEELNKSGLSKGFELENIRKTRKESINSFTVYRNFNQYKKEEFKKIIDDPLFPNIVYGNDVGCIKGFSAKSFVNFKKSNEDKLNISINVKINDEKGRLNKVNVNYFSIFDGHGGENVAEQLKDSLHKQIIHSKQFLESPTNSILNAFSKFEEKIMKNNLKVMTSNPEKSGSCALCAIFINDLCYIANLGDSRGIISRNFGNSINAISIDHKPGSETEKTRIIRAGGFVYKSDILYEVVPNSDIYRIKPGGLAVSRTIGDIESKLNDYGGKPNLVLAIPDIISFQILEDFDFLILASDGIYYKLSNKDLTIITLETCLETMIKGENFEKFLINVENNILKEAIDRDSRDNISCIFICFKNFYDVFMDGKIEKIKASIEGLRNTNNEFESLYDNLLTRYFYNEISLLKNDKAKKNEIEKEKKRLGKFNQNNFKNINKKSILQYFCMCLGIKNKKK